MDKEEKIISMFDLFDYTENMEAETLVLYGQRKDDGAFEKVLEFDLYDFFLTKDRYFPVFKIGVSGQRLQSNVASLP